MLTGGTGGTGGPKELQNGTPVPAGQAALPAVPGTPGNAANPWEDASLAYSCHLLPLLVAFPSEHSKNSLKPLKTTNNSSHHSQQGEIPFVAVIHSSKASPCISWVQIQVFHAREAHTIPAVSG